MRRSAAGEVITCRLGPTQGRRARFAAVSLLGLLAACADTASAPDESVEPEAEAVAEPLAQAGGSLTRSLEDALRDYRARPQKYGPTESLKQYAARCDKATGITVPTFSCEDGSTVPNQGDTPRGRSCDRPNVLNRVCDPGSKFQVLPGGNADAVAVAHCRKNGKPITGTTYQDIAVIQYNKKNGAVCFYQALGTLEGSRVTAPKEESWSWLPPTETQGIGCTGCHDTGGFLRSSYLAQELVPAKGKPKFALPSQDQGFSNRHPLRPVGVDWQQDQVWSVKLAGSSPCTTCHNLGVNQPGDDGASSGFGGLNTGTATSIARIATDQTQVSRLPAMPPWMPPRVTAYSKENFETALRYENCAKEFLRTKKQPAGCIIEQDKSRLSPWPLNQ